MMKSAGVLFYRFENALLQVLLVHPGGPFWKNKDSGSWSIPKGEFKEKEIPLDAAKREFEEETGVVPEGNFMKLTPVKQKGGKIIMAWALKGNMNSENVRSNTFKMEWPPHSGQLMEFPEVDKANWFSVNEAKIKINPGQIKFIEELVSLLTKKE